MIIQNPKNKGQTLTLNLKTIVCKFIVYFLNYFWLNYFFNSKWANISSSPSILVASIILTYGLT